MFTKKDIVFMAKAKVAASQGTCCRKQVGCIIVSPDGHDRVTGYNGSLPKQPHCTDPGIGCLMEEGHCIRTVHSESNAVSQAARYGVSLEGCTLYVTAMPCFTCFKLVVSAGVKRIVYGEKYGAPHALTYAQASGVEMVDGSTIPLLGLSV